MKSFKSILDGTAEREISTTIEDFFVPELGDFKAVSVNEVLVKLGDSVQVDGRGLI